MRDLQEQVKAEFAAVYLTLISVIQGSVLGYLLGQADSILGTLGLRSGLLLLDGFLVIGAIWHEYVMGTTTFRWIPRLPDAFLPMLLGACQFVMARSIASPTSAWFFGLSALCVVGFLAFSNQYRAARRYPENDEVFRALGPWPRITQVLVAGGAVLAALAGWLDGLVDEGRGAWPGAAALASVVPVAYLARSAWYWGRIFPKGPAP